MSNIPFSPQQRVGVGTPRNPRASVAAAQAPFQAIAGAGQALGAVAQQHLANKKAVANEALRVEEKLLSQELGGKLQVNQFEYDSEVASGVRVDYNVMGTEEDASLAGMNDVNDEILSDPRGKRHPELMAKLGIDAEHNMSMSAAKGRTAGFKALKSRGEAVINTNLDYAVAQANLTQGLAIVEDGRGTLLDNEEADKLINELPSRIARSSFDRQYESDPANALAELKRGAYDTVISSIDEEGNVTTVPSNLKAEDKKSMKAYAKALLSENQIEASNQMAMPNSDYSNLSPAEKLKWLETEVGLKNISVGTFKTSTDLVKTPRFIDQKTEHRKALLNTTMALRKSGGNMGIIAQELDSFNELYVPEEFRRTATTLGIEITDPNSKYNSPRFEQARDLYDAGFGSVDVVPEESGFFGKIAGITPLHQATPRGFVEQRDALVINAEFEARQIGEKWLATDGADATPQQVSAFVSRTILDAKARYGIPLLAERMAEILEVDALADEAEDSGEAPNKEKEVADLSDLDATLKKYPDWSEDKAKRYLKSIGR